MSLNIKTDEISLSSETPQIKRAQSVPTGSGRSSGKRSPTILKHESSYSSEGVVEKTKVSPRRLTFADADGRGSLEQINLADNLQYSPKSYTRNFMDEPVAEDHDDMDEVEQMRGCCVIA